MQKNSCVHKLHSKELQSIAILVSVLQCLHHSLRFLCQCHFSTDIPYYSSFFRKNDLENLALHFETHIFSNLNLNEKTVIKNMMYNFYMQIKFSMHFNINKG